MKLKKHLDLGCGNKPKNPYKAEMLYGVDFEKINPNSIKDIEVIEIKNANLSLEKIPYKSNFFDSLSAYDFLEHVPRIISKLEKNKLTTHYAFIECMNEIFRVLKHKGRFYAVTPIYPDASAFVDPTHVNIMSYKTFQYFCLPSLGAKMYGFNGKFQVIRVKKIRPKYIYEPHNLNLKQKLRKLNDKLKRLESHLLWEFEAIKN